MQIINLSHNIEIETPLYGGIKGEIDIIQTSSIDNGNTSNNSKICFPSHCGTHIDFPLHFNSSGKSFQDYPESFWYFTKIGFIECPVEEVLEKIIPLQKDIEILILKTNFEQFRNTDKYWASQPRAAA